MRFRLVSSRLALWLGVLLLGLLALAVPLSVVAHEATGGGLVPLLLPMLFGGVGVLVAARQARNPIGWIMLVFALSFTIGEDGGFYSVAAFRLGRHGLPLARLSVVFATGWVGLILMPLTILLFPDGRLPSPRWRWTLWLYVALAGGFVGVVGVADIGAFTDQRISVDSSGELSSLGGSGWIAVASIVLLLAVVVLSLSWVVRQLVAYRRSAGELREQLKWLISGGCVCLVGLLATVFLSGRHSPVLEALSAVGGVGMAALPVGVGVGILKYRLYEIDRLISRTLSYTILTGLLVGVFVGIVVLTTHVLPFSSPVGVAASTLAAAALFNPLRVRVQRLVDRRFNRARYDAEAIVAAFSAHLREAVDLDTIRYELVAAVEDAVQPAHASVWVRPVITKGDSGTEMSSIS
jgi:hypothetical protein